MYSAGSRDEFNGYLDGEAEVGEHRGQVRAVGCSDVLIGDAASRRPSLGRGLTPLLHRGGLLHIVHTCVTTTARIQTVLVSCSVA